MRFSHSLKQKILFVILVTAFIPTVFLLWFTYHTFDQSYTELLEQQYWQVVNWAGDRLLACGTEQSALDQLGMVIEEIPLLEKGYFEIRDAHGTLIGEQKQKRSWLAQSVAANLDKLEIERELENYGWTIRLTVDKVSVQSDLYKLRGMLILLVLVIAIAVCLMAHKLSYGIIEPLSDMIAQMERVERGELKVNIAIESDDEIGLLTQKFNAMIGRLREYINRCYITRLRQRDAELHALKAQIDPHYLNNTLEVIRMTAVDEGAELAAEMIQLLSFQMRYTITAEDDIVVLKSELAFIRSYVQLINYRYANPITLNIIEGDWSDCVVPRLSFNPLLKMRINMVSNPKIKMV